MTKDSHPILAREGWVHIAIALIASVLVTYFFGWCWAAPLWFITVFVLQFFRDPPRAANAAPNELLAPADGRVIALGEGHDPYLNRPCKRISIFMNVFNVHSNRSPIAGQVMERWYSAGAFLNAALDKASEQNERNALWIKTDSGQDIVVVQVAGLIARRILCYVAPGERVTLGQRYGFIRFGSRVDLYLPVDTTIKASLGDRTTGAVDVVATLSR
jgi:phosphatidylserine decarboxylase